MDKKFNLTVFEALEFLRKMQNFVLNRKFDIDLLKIDKIKYLKKFRRNQYFNVELFVLK